MQHEIQNNSCRNINYHSDSCNALANGGDSMAFTSKEDNRNCSDQNSFEVTELNANILVSKLKKDKNGFSLVELLVVISVTAILAAIAFFAVGRLRQTYTLEEYAAQMNSAVQYARMYSIQHTTNVGVCVTSNSFHINDLTSDRTIKACQEDASGVTTVRKITPVETYIHMKMTASAGGGVVFDSRGLLVNGNAVQTFCIDEGQVKSYVITVGPLGSSLSSSSGVCL
jgi:prepilin-type N-terminal cleavage/methylation domain-containing protein